MSILIKGMEMPKNCLYCRFCVDNEERMYTVCTALNKDFDNGIIVYENRRRDDCPLISIPPHGRLIDADALIKDGWVLQKYEEKPTHSAILTMPLNCPSVPTIIEADMDSFIRIFEEDSEEDGMDSFIRILKD